MNVPVETLARAAGAEIVGNAGTMVSGFADLDHAKPGDLVFAEQPTDLPRALTSEAAAIVTGAFARASANGKTLLLCDQPRLSFARMVRAVADRDGCPGGTVSPAASIDPSASLDATAAICRDAVIEAGARIGARTRVGTRAIIERDVHVGTDCEIGPNVVIHAGAVLGDRVCVHAGAVLGGRGFGYVRDATTGRHERFPQVGSLEIGDDVEIGANVTIDRGTFRATRIGRGTKIDNLVHVAHNVRIGENVVIAAQTGIAGSAVVEDNVVLAGQAGIADHARIEAGVLVGAQAGVPTGKVLRGAGQVFWGTPARPIRGVLRELAALARLARR